MVATGWISLDVQLFGAIPTLLPAIALPALAGTLLLYSADFRARVDAVPMAWLAALHGLRIAFGFVFLAIYELGAIPAVFAHRGGYGDILAGLLGLLVAYLPAGSLAWRRFSPDTVNGPANLLFSATCALGLMILVTTAYGVCGALSPSGLLATPVVLGLLAWREWPRLAADLKAAGRAVARESATLPGVLWWLVGLAALVLNLTPAVSQDALHYHLAVPAQWLEAGGFVEISGNVYSRFPMNIEMLYLNALAFRGEIAAKAFHWILAMLAAGLVRLLAAQFASSRAASWASVIFLSTPTIFRVTTWGESPLASACVCSR